MLSIKSLIEEKKHVVTEKFEFESGDESFLVV